MCGPAYDVLLVVHVVVGLVGFGAVAVGGFEARKARQAPDPARDESVKRFFRPGIDWPARLIFLVPVVGLGLLFGGDRADEGAAWPWIGLAIWVAAAGVATGSCWPAERQAQRALRQLANSEPTSAGEISPVAGAAPPVAGEVEVWLDRFRTACRRMETASGAIAVCFVAAVVVMIVQP